MENIIAVEIIKFSKRNLENIPLVDKGRMMYRDEKERFLFLFVTPKNKTYYFYRKYNGRPRQIKIDNFENISIQQARNIIIQFNNNISNGKEPTEKKQHVKFDIKTFGELFESYVNAKSDKKSLNLDIQLFNSNLKQFQRKEIAQLSYHIIYNFHKSMKQTPALANRTLALLSSIYSFAKKELRINIENPCIGIKKYQEHPRQRILNNVELHRYLDTCTAWSIIPDKAMYSDIFMMLLYTGQRKTNVLQMKFTDIDFVSRSWSLTPEQTKNNDYHRISLVPEAIEILQLRYNELRNKSIYVFPSPRCLDKPIVEIKRQWENFLKDAEISNLTRHDMRRTAGSIVLMVTGNLKLVQKMLGHKDISTTAKVYSHIWEEREALEIDNAFKSIRKLN